MGDAGIVGNMTIGTLSRRTRVPVKALREYEDLGLIYTIGRSRANYRLFDDDALWCVAVVGTLRQLGLTLAEIQQLAGPYMQGNKGPIGPTLARVLRVVRSRTQDRIAELQRLLTRIDDFEATHHGELTGVADFRATDPHHQVGA